MNGLKQFLILFRTAIRGRRRNTAGKRSTAGRAASITGTVFTCLLLAFFGTSIGTLAQSEGPTIIFGFMPFILFADFAMRFALQQSVIDMKPFLLLPTRRHIVATSLLLASLADGYSLAWLCLFVPYAATALAASGCGLPAAVGIVLACAVVMVANNLWYLFVRLLVTISAAWWWLPAAIYSLALIAGISGSHAAASSHTLVNIGRDFGFTPQSVTLYATLSAVLWLADCALLMRTARADETHKSKRRAPGNTIALTGHRSLTSEYIKLEIKSIMRNRAMKRNFVQGLLFMAIIATALPALMSHEGYVTTLPFWCMYCFLYFDMTMLVRVMEPEGNYIDLLMTRKESIFTLLEAKYCFYCAVLLLPLAAMIPAVVTGRMPWLFVVACLLTTTGTAHFVLFQLAASNNRTMQLDGKADGKPKRNSTRQTIYAMTVLAVPLTAMTLLSSAFGNAAACWTMIALGTALTVTHRLWLGNVYRRMMKRKYENIESFCATRI